MEIKGKKEKDEKQTTKDLRSEQDCPRSQIAAIEELLKSADSGAVLE